uniref:Uncharacterized protein n=1 Tax=Lactuca sativa TaxID=4236 RepID=A0A9R1VLE3_LACSA|nr:hypothetical protein LSAT_V11C500265080 [Lactuca sativa]
MIPIPIPFLIPLQLDDVIDLVIPRGSNNLVSQIKSSIKIPVLEMAENIVLDSKTGYPSACNAMETLLLHKDLLQDGIANQLIKDLYTKGPKARLLLDLPEAPSLHHEYSIMSCTIEVVDDVDAAIHHKTNIEGM